MKPARRILAVLLGAALLLGSLCACGSTAGTDADTDTNTENSVAQQLYDTPVAAPDLTNATTITLSGTDDVTVSDGGVYVLTGTLTAGRVLVNAPDADVTLVLQDADITCSDSSALYIYKAANVLLYLPDGTASTLTDGSSYGYGDGVSSAADEEPNACLYAKSDLIIAGGGTLTVTGNAGNGITGKDTLKIEDTAVSVTAANHGINGKDCLVLKQADVTVTSGGDALRATNDSDTTLGCVLIGASALTLTAGEDGIQAETTLTLFDTTGTVTSGGGSGGALALAVADRVWILENAVYSVVSPEGCASILWKDAKKAKEAAECLHLTAQDMEKLGVVERVISESGKTKAELFSRVKEMLAVQTDELCKKDTETLLKERYERFRKY